MNSSHMEELPGIEPGLQESEPCVLKTNYTIAPNKETC